MRLFILLYGMFIFTGCSQAISENVENKTESFFSLKEIHDADSKTIAPLEFIKGSDNTSLAFRVYIPENPQAIVIFYHGAGAHSGLTYNHIGAGLATEYKITE